MAIKILTSEKRLRDLGNIAFKVQAIVFPPTKEILQFEAEEGITSYYEDVKDMILDVAKSKDLICSIGSGAFRFEKMKSGDVKMIPSFSFIIKIKKN